MPIILGFARYISKGRKWTSTKVKCYIVAYDRVQKRIALYSLCPLISFSFCQNKHPKQSFLFPKMESCVPPSLKILSKVGFHYNNCHPKSNILSLIMYFSYSRHISRLHHTFYIFLNLCAKSKWEAYQRMEGISCSTITSILLVIIHKTQSMLLGLKYGSSDTSTYLRLYLFTTSQVTFII